jgi:hypothetical protein
MIGLALAGAACVDHIRSMDDLVIQLTGDGAPEFIAGGSKPASSWTPATAPAKPSRPRPRPPRRRRRTFQNTTLAGPRRRPLLSRPARMQPAPACVTKCVTRYVKPESITQLDALMNNTFTHKPEKLRTWQSVSAAPVPTIFGPMSESLLPRKFGSSSLSTTAPAIPPSTSQHTHKQVLD